MSTPKLLHEKCKCIITTRDIVNYKCEICGTNLVGPSIGGYKICAGCSEELDLCEQCGKPMIEKKEDE
jgi:hypothetical protein